MTTKHLYSIKKVKEQNQKWGMISVRTAKKNAERQKMPRALTPEGREDQIIAYAMDVAEERILNGTASDGLLIQFLKQGSSKERLEREIMAEQKKLIEAKTEAIESAKRVEELYREALKAMRTYSGTHDDDEVY